MKSVLKKLFWILMFSGACVYATVDTEEVDTVSLVVFTEAQDSINCTVPRKDVVAKDKSKTDLYEVAYWKE